MSNPTSAPVDIDTLLTGPLSDEIIAFFDAHVDQLSFCMLPPDVLPYARELGEHRYLTLRVVRQPGYGWSVRTIFDKALSGTGHWRHGSNNRTPKAREHTSFDLRTAINLAQREAAKLSIGRYSFPAYVAKLRADIAAEVD